MPLRRYHIDGVGGYPCQSIVSKKTGTGSSKPLASIAGAGDQLRPFPAVKNVDVEVITIDGADHDNIVFPRHRIRPSHTPSDRRHLHQHTLKLRTPGIPEVTLGDARMSVSRGAKGGANGHALLRTPTNVYEQ